MGLKAESTLHRDTFDRSSAKPGETLYVNIPRLAENVVIVPGSVNLLFDISLEGHANRTLVNNIGRNLVSQLRVIIGGEVISDTCGYDLFHTFHDLFYPYEKSSYGLKYGNSSLSLRKHRTGAGDKNSDAKEISLAAIYGTKYRIAIDHPIIKDNGAFYPLALSQPVRFEITLAPVSDIVVYADVVKKPGYILENLELEYTCITSEFLARKCVEEAQIGRGFQYEHVLLHESFDISKPNDGVINKRVNVPRRSMTGILCLFVEAYDGGKRDSEKFVNPDITSVMVSIDGLPNKLYSKGMVPSDFLDEMMKRLGHGPDVRKREIIYPRISQESFYTGDKFGLWIDLRTFPDNDIHGGGLKLTETGNK